MNKYILLMVFALILVGCTAERRIFEEMAATQKALDETGIFEKMAAAQRALDERASKELIGYMSLETMFPDSRVRALAKAAGRGQIGKIDKLVDQGVNVNARGTGGATPLFWALRNVKGFRRLLELGADPNAVFGNDGDGGTMMHWAVRHKNSEFLKLTLQYGGNPNIVGSIDKRTPLFVAMGPRNKSKAPILLDAGADMNFQGGNGHTPMMTATALGQFDIVFDLLERGADYQLRDYYTNGTLMDHIAFSRRTIDPESDGAQWMKKVINWLEARGAKIPEWKNPAEK